MPSIGDSPATSFDALVRPRVPRRDRPPSVARRRARRSSRAAAGGSRAARRHPAPDRRRDRRGTRRSACPLTWYLGVADLHPDARSSSRRPSPRRIERRPGHAVRPPSRTHRSLRARLRRRPPVDAGRPPTPAATPNVPVTVQRARSAAPTTSISGAVTRRSSRLAPGRFHLRLEDFSVRNGPDLYVYLSPATDGYADGARRVGKLKATDGAFGYDLPDGDRSARFRERHHLVQTVQPPVRRGALRSADLEMRRKSGLYNARIERVSSRRQTPRKRPWPET